MYKKIMPSLISSIENLPEMFMVDILSRLPVETILHCKCVCKKWRNLVLGSHFANIHLSRSPACLMIHHYERDELLSISDVYVNYKRIGGLSWLDTTGELDDLDLNSNSVKNFDLCRAPIFKNSEIVLAGSVNGLICVEQFHNEIYDAWICNPITREYMILPRKHDFTKVPKHRTIQRDPRERTPPRKGCSPNVYGFGVGLQKEEYKVVRISRGNIPLDRYSTSQALILETEVYTLGSGQWRSLGHAPYRINECHGIFLKGRVHWIVLDPDSPEMLCSFDFDNEIFQLFPSPPVESEDKSHRRQRCENLGILKGCLFHAELLHKFEFTIWVMKEYGNKYSWHKEMSIKQSINRDIGWLNAGDAYVIEGLKDDTVLLVNNFEGLLVLSLRSKTVEEGYLLMPCNSFIGIAYHPGFLNLQINFESERVYVL